MQLTITPKKPFETYSPEEQAAILERGAKLELCEQGEERSLEDTFCLVAYRRSLRSVNFKPTVEKIVKEKPLTKAQKLEILEQVVKLGNLPLTDKQQQVVDELVGVGKEYYLFTDILGAKELLKLTKTNIKKKVQELVARGSLCLKSGSALAEELSASEQEFLTAMTKEV